VSIGEKGQVFSDVAQCASVRFATHSLIFTKSPEVEVNAAPVLMVWNSTLVISITPLWFLFLMSLNIRKIERPVKVFVVISSGCL